MKTIDVFRLLLRHVAAAVAATVTVTVECAAAYAIGAALSNDPGGPMAPVMFVAFSLFFGGLASVVVFLPASLVLHRWSRRRNPGRWRAIGWFSLTALCFIAAWVAVRNRGSSAGEIAFAIIATWLVSSSGFAVYWLIAIPRDPAPNR